MFYHSWKVSANGAMRSILIKRCTSSVALAIAARSVASRRSVSACTSRDLSRCFLSLNFGADA
eukprot:12893766-Prorocentrum_lima.AAC.1